MRAGASSGLTAATRLHPPDPFAATPDELQQWANRRSLPPRTPTPSAPASRKNLESEARPIRTGLSDSRHRPELKQSGTSNNSLTPPQSRRTPDSSLQVDAQCAPVVISKIDSAAAAEQFEQKKQALLQRPFFKKLEAAATRVEVQPSESD